MKSIIFLVLSLFAANVFACPYLDGRYDRCYSELKNMRGEYIINQVDENGVNVFNVQFIDDETDESRTDVIRANGKIEKRKERVPKIGIKVNIESKAYCKDNIVYTDSEAFALFGTKVGEFQTRLFKVNNQLQMLVDGQYVGRKINKIIKCQLVGTEIEKP